MSPAGCIVLLSALIPLVIALSANRSTSLIHALCWAIVAWIAWFAAFAFGLMSLIYLALALTVCAGVAVLGARRPGAAAWNFVVVGLTIVLVLPLAEAEAARTTLRLNPMRMVFLSCLLGVTVINYLPTRLGGGAILLAASCGLAMREITDGESVGEPIAWCIGLTPWACWLGMAAMRAARSGDYLWRQFRDRYGLIWSLRLREQFNRSAANAGLPVELRWTGLRGESDAAALDLLTQLTRRFFG